MLVDTHCHLFFEPLLSRIEGVLSRASHRGVEKIVVPAFDPASWTAVRDLARPGHIYPALGVHPWVADKPHSINVLADRLTEIGAVAVGEIGLDFKVAVPREVQLSVFESQLHLAADLGLPVLLHVRGAFEEMVDLLTRCTPRPRGVVHAFSRGPELAKRFLDLGLYIAFGGAITHERARRARRAALKVPLDSVLLETDAPSIGLDGVAPVDVEPSHTADVAAALASIRVESINTIAEVTTQNAFRLFGFDNS